MVVIFHGDDTVVSRTKLEEYLSDKTTILRFDSSTTILTILDAFNSQELFSVSKTIVIENIHKFSKKEQKIILSEVQEKAGEKDLEICFWDENILTAGILNQFKNAKVMLYTLPKYYFLFLDGLAPGNAKQSIDLISRMYPEIADTQIFYSVVKRIRQLMLIKTGKLNDFEETKSISPWQLTKLKKQAFLWNEKELADFYVGLFEPEKSMKTSNLPLPLIKHIDILLTRTL